MRAIQFIVVGGCAVYLAVTYFNQSKRDTLIREHRFDLAMSADDVQSSLGEPLHVVSTGPTSATWLYPTVSIDFGRGKVVGSHAIALATPAPFVPQRTANVLTARDPHSRDPQPNTSKTPVPLLSGTTNLSNAKIAPRSLLDQPAHR